MHKTPRNLQVQVNFGFGVVWLQDVAGIQFESCFQHDSLRPIMDLISIRFDESLRDGHFRITCQNVRSSPWFNVWDTNSESNLDQFPHFKASMK